MQVFTFVHGPEEREKKRKPGLIYRRDSCS